MNTPTQIFNMVCSAQIDEISESICTAKIRPMILPGRYIVNECVMQNDAFDHGIVVCTICFNGGETINDNMLVRLLYHLDDNDDNDSEYVKLIDLEATLLNYFQCRHTKKTIVNLIDELLN